MNGRPLLRAALAELSVENGRRLMSSKLDRLFRSAVDFGQLLARWAQGASMREIGDETDGARSRTGRRVLALLRDPAHHRVARCSYL